MRRQTGYTQNQESQSINQSIKTRHDINQYAELYKTMLSLIRRATNAPRNTSSPQVPSLVSSHGRNGPAITQATIIRRQEAIQEFFDIASITIIRHLAVSVGVEILKSSTIYAGFSGQAVD